MNMPKSPTQVISLSLSPRNSCHETVASFYQRWIVHSALYTNIVPEFLLHVMEVREAIEEGDEKQLAQIQEENSKLMEDCIKKVSSKFRSNQLDQVVQDITRLQYHVTILNALEEKTGKAIPFPADP